MLQMMKSKQSQPSQLNTLHHQGMSLFGGCCRYTQFWAIFQPCKGFFMASFDPALAHMHYLFGMTSKKRHCTSTRDFFLGPRTAQISAAAKRKAGSKAESFEIRSRTLRFCLWFSLVNQKFWFTQTVSWDTDKLAIGCGVSGKKSTPVCITWLLLYTQISSTYPDLRGHVYLLWLPSWILLWTYLGPQKKDNPFLFPT